MATAGPDPVDPITRDARAAERYLEEERRFAAQRAEVQARVDRILRCCDRLEALNAEIFGILARIEALLKRSEAG